MLILHYYCETVEVELAKLVLQTIVDRRSIGNCTLKFTFFEFNTVPGIYLI